MRKQSFQSLNSSVTVRLCASYVSCDFTIVLYLLDSVFLS